MRIKLVISALLISLILFSCDKKPTPSEPDIERYRFTINARVVDLQGDPVKYASVVAKAYVLSPDIPEYGVFLTKADGRISSPYMVLIEKNEVDIFARTESHCSDTIHFIVEYDGFVYDRGENFVLKHER